MPFKTNMRENSPSTSIFVKLFVLNFKNNMVFREKDNDPCFHTEICYLRVPETLYFGGRRLLEWQSDYLQRVDSNSNALIQSNTFN